jgi:hypothetical protein
MNDDYLCKLKIKDKKTGFPFTKIEGNKSMLMMKFGLESDELERMISSKKYPRRKR